MKLELEDLGFRTPLPAALPRHRARAEARARQSEGIPGQDPHAARSGAQEGRTRGPRRGAREAPLQHLPQDAAQARGAGRDRRCLWTAHHRRLGRHLLSRARRRAQRLQTDAGPLQGLRRDPARQRLSVAAHDAVRAQWRTDRGTDPHRRHGPRRRVGHRGALEVQGRRERGLGAAGACAQVAVEPGRDGGRRQLRGIHRERQGRPVSRQGLRVHAARRDPAAAARRHRGGFRLCRPHRHRQSLRRGQGRSTADAAAHGAAQRTDRPDHHRQGREPQSILGEFRRHRQGALGDPALPEEPASQRGGRARAAPAGQALAEFDLELDAVPPERLAVGADGIRAQGRRGAVREDRPRRTARAAGGAPAAAGGATPTPPTARRLTAGGGRHRGAAGQLRALLLPAAERSDLRVPEHRPRHRRPSRDLRQRRGLPQAAGKVAAGHLAAQARAAVPGGDPHRHRQSHGHAGGAVGGDRRHQDQRQPRLDRSARCRNPGPDLHRRGVRPRAPGAHHARRAPHARCAARGARHRQQGPRPAARAPRRCRRYDRPASEHQ